MRHVVGSIGLLVYSAEWINGVCYELNLFLDWLVCEG